MKAVLVFLAWTYRSGPGKSAKALSMIGGGKKNVAWTCTIMKVLTLLLYILWYKVLPLRKQLLKKKRNYVSPCSHAKVIF
jgi:hypothetical protein